MAIRFRNGGGGNVTHPEQQRDVVPTAGGFVHLSQQDQVDANPVVHHVSVYKTRARMLDESRVDRRARQMQAAHSYDDWDGLSDGDKELWRHMARLEMC
jgi:hypothetical protein